MSDDLTDEFGERIRHFPMCKPDVNSRPQTDPSRPVQTCSVRNGGPLMGIFEDWHDELDITKGHSATRAVPATRISSRHNCLSIDKRDLQSDVKTDDLFAICERGTVYIVTDVQPDGHGRVKLRLAQRGRPEIGK